MNGSIVHYADAFHEPRTELSNETGVLYLESDAYAPSILTRDAAYLERLAAAASSLAAEIRGQQPEPEPTEPEPTELKHPGTWLPGDRVVSAGDDSWTFVRDLGGEWPATNGKGFLIDRDINISHQTGSVRITHLVPRTDGAR